MGRSNRLYIGHISSRIREKDIDYEFGRYGRIRDLSLKQGFAFLEYEKAEDAEYAIRKMDGVNLEGLRITVEFAKELPVRQPQKGGSGYRLVCENLSPYTSWQDLKDFARKAGKVTYTDVYSERGEKMGIIEYATKEDMEEALYSLDGRELHRYRCKLYKEGGSRSGGGGGDRDRDRDRGDRDRDRDDRGRDRSRSRSPRDRKERRSRSRSRSRSGDRRRDEEGKERDDDKDRKREDKEERSPADKGKDEEEDDREGGAAAAVTTVTTTRTRGGGGGGRR